MQALIVTLVVPAFGVVIWLVRLEGRVNGHDKALERVMDDISYIRGRIDDFLDGGRR